MNKLRVGVITTTHGIKGEVKVYPTTSDIKRFDYLKEAFIDDIKYEVEYVKYYKNNIIIKFKNINDMNCASKLRNKNIMVDRENAIPLKKGEYFVSDVLGFDVYTDENEHLGTLDDIIETKANRVYVVNNLLIPEIKDCIINVDLQKRIMIVHLLEGLR